MYQDEVSFKQAGSIFRHWALKDIGRVVKAPPTRKSLKVMGAVAAGNHPKFHFRFVDWLNTKNFLTFQDQLISRHQDQKIHLVLDNAKYHKGPEVGNWINGKQDCIGLQYLPAYCSKFNAAEYVGKETRRKTTNNRFFETLSSLKERLFRRFSRL